MRPLRDTDRISMYLRRNYMFLAFVGASRQFLGSIYYHALMKIFRALAALGLAVSFLVPDIALAANTWRAQDPCGMMVCCCPTMCKMARKGRLACRMQGRHGCGIRSASERASLSPLSFLNLLSGRTPYALLRVDVCTLGFVPSIAHLWHSAVRSLLDKPPAVLS